MPLGLSKAAKKIWRETVGTMLTVEGLLTIADGSVLGDYCQLRAEKTDFLKAIELRARAGAATLMAEAAEKGRKLPQASAAVLALEIEMRKSGNALDKLRHRENVLRRELGLSPSARSSIRIGGKPREHQNPVDGALFGGRRNLVAV